jgi:hypothetical protein
MYLGRPPESRIVGAAVHGAVVPPGRPRFRPEHFSEESGDTIACGSLSFDVE